VSGEGRLRRRATRALLALAAAALWIPASLAQETDQGAPAPAPVPAPAPDEADLAPVSSAPVAGPDDPLFRSAGSWGQAYEDQWALHRIGLLELESGASAWSLETGASQPVTVAVIDTGLDWLHPDFDRARLWRNPNELLNGIDDDHNGYVDDVIGWDFVDGTNRPWDQAGHGTHVAGIIAAATDNGMGIAGVSRGARILPLKALNAAGRGRSSAIAAAIFYAVDHGAQVINLSLGGERLSAIERRALRYARDRGALVVIAAGNRSRDRSADGLADLEHAIVVGATGRDDRRAPFSNWGRAVDLAAPGVQVLSLRARGTDLVQASGAERYAAGAAIVGGDGQYLRASGTSFAAALVSGVASLLLAKSPALEADDVRRVLLQSARDVEPAGFDQLTGYGLLDARAALQADPAFFVEARIDAVETAEENEAFVQVRGTADASEFAGAVLELEAIGDPSAPDLVPQRIEAAVRDGVLVRLHRATLERAPAWSLRLVAQHADGRSREARFVLRLGGSAS
jgi:subtilisin family serine protease